MRQKKRIEILEAKIMELEQDTSLFRRLIPDYQTYKRDSQSGRYYLCGVPEYRRTLVHEDKLRDIIALLPDLWEIETYVISDPPAKQSQEFQSTSVKATNKLTGKFAYGATREEAIQNVS